MKGLTILLMMLAVMTGMVHAQSSDSNRVNLPVDISFGPGISIGGVVQQYGDRTTVRGVALNLIAGSTSRLEGAAFGGIWNHTVEYVEGAQFGGVLNTIEGRLHGAQFAGVANFVKGPVRGWQYAGVANVAGESLKGVQVGGVANVSGPVRGFQFGGLLNTTGGQLRGGQVAGLANFVDDAATGWQYAGVANISGGSLKGVQAGGVTNISGAMRGVQAAGVNNLARGHAHGFQLAGVANVSKSLHGAQIAGVVNVTGTANGFQLGVVNVSRDMTGVPIGLLSYVHRVGLAYEVVADETGFVHTVIRSGTAAFSNYVGMGARSFGDRSYRWAATAGLGLQKSFGQRVYGMVDLLSRTVVNEDFDESTNTMNTLRLAFGFRLGRHISLVGGPTLNMLIADDDFGDDLPPWTIYESTTRTLYGALWPGFSFGLRINGRAAY